MNMDYFRNIQGAKGLSNYPQVLAEEAKARLAYDLLASPHCEYDAKRNGVTQKFVITNTDSMHKLDILSFPDEDLNIGDYIECHNQMWIVSEKSAINTFQWRGRLLQCNHKFKFQNGTSTVIERWGVLDSGVYSTSEKDENIARTPDQQYKLYFQLDDETRKIFIGKRLATQQWVDEKLNNILLCYRVTAIESVEKNYCNDSHLLLLRCRGDLYDPKLDNYSEMICDYIDPNASQTATGGDWF